MWDTGSTNIVCNSYNDKVMYISEENRDISDSGVNVHCKDVILHNLGRSLRLATFYVGSVKSVNA